MTYLLIILLVALIACLVLFPRMEAGDPRRKALVVCAALIAAGGIVIGAVDFFQPGSAGDPASPEQSRAALGRVFGRALGEDFPDGGRVLVVFPRNLAGPNGRGIRRDYVAGLMRGVGDAPFDFVEKVNDVGDDATRGLTAAAVRELCSGIDGPVAVVSFDYVFETLDGRGLDGIAPLYILPAGRSDTWKSLLRNGTVRAAVIAKTAAAGGDDGASGGGSAARYTLFRPSDVARAGERPADTGR